MRIAQITDFHLRQATPGTASMPRRRSREMAKLLERALAQIAAQRVDLLAVTGDLVDVPNWLIQPVPGFTLDVPEPWRRAVLEDYRLIRRMLDATGLRYCVLPGNHDHEELLWQVFDPDANVIEVAGHRVVRFCDREHDAHVPRRFIPERDRFDAELSRKDGLPQVHLQHYLIAPALNESYPHAYGESEFLANCIEQSGVVRLSLSGHYHAGTELIERGPARFATGPAFCDAPFRWRVYDLSNAQITFTEHALGDDAAPRRPVVFIDRDGVINDRPSFRVGPEHMRLLPGSARGIRRLNDAGYAVVVVTNQSAVGRGFFPASIMEASNDRMCRLLAEEAGAHVDAIYCALEAGPDACMPCYTDLTRPKPRPTMLLEAIADLNLDPSGGAWMIGDNITDAQAGAGAGASPILVRTGHGERMEPRFREQFPNAPVVTDLAAAADVILSR